MKEQGQTDDTVSYESTQEESAEDGLEDTPKELISSTEAENIVRNTEEELNEDTQAAAEDEVNAVLTQMTLEEKAAQLFVILPEALLDGVDTVTEAGDLTKEAIGRIPVGGFVYLAGNLQSEAQVKTMLANVQAYSMERIGLPAFLCVDEEGGAVARLSGSDAFGIPAFETMAEVGQSQDTGRAKEIGQTMGAYLSDFGFNVDFAPVADVLSNSENEVVRQRSFGSDPQLVSNMAAAVAEGLQEQGVYAVYKHFPGHGMTAGDTHAGYASSEKTLEEMKACELLPFLDGIEAGISFMMAAHISLPQIAGDVPASLSEALISGLLRDQMGYDGIVVTDAMNMGAVTQQYSSAEAAVLALKAGADIILMPKDFKEAYDGVIEAVHNGTLSEERIDESLKRILKVKLKMKE